MMTTDLTVSTQAAPLVPQVAGALAIIFTAQPRDTLPPETIALYGMMLAEYDAELLKWAAVECVNQIKWVPKVSEIEEVIHMIERLIASKNDYHRKKFVGRATVNADASLHEFRNRCKAGTLDYIEGKRKARAEMRRNELELAARSDAIEWALDERIAQARAHLANAVNPESVTYWRDYIAHLEAQR